jgi:general secretion pathway protein F
MAHSFAYRAVDSAGTTRAGEVLSVSRPAALEALSRQGLVPIEVSESVSGVTAATVRRFSRKSLQWRFPSRRRPREVLELTQSLGALLGAGLTIDRALQISASLTPHASGRAFAEALLEKVRAGKTLSDSVEMSGQRLPPYYVSMVKAGEASGSLASTLARLTELMRRQLEVRERIRSALVYPALLAAMVLLTLIILLTFVLPRFETLFAESEAPLPLSTRSVLALGRFVAGYWWLMLALAASLTAAAVAWLRSSAGRTQFDQWIVRSRLTMGLPAAINTARLLRTLSTLCASGLPLPAALRVARGTLANRRMLDALSQVAREVQAGEPFSAALARAGVFPPVAAHLARVGEETGKLDSMLHSAAGVLEEESQTRLEQLLTLFVPLLTVAMGVIVAALVGSVLIGLLSINDLAF